MKKILIATIILCFSLSPIHAEDYETAHSFSAGDVISADMMNEIFDDLEGITQVIDEIDFIGSWDITQTTCKDGGPGNCSSLSVTGMTNDANGITRSRTDTVSFTNDGDGTFSFLQANYASLVRAGAGNSSGSGDFAVINGFGLFNDSTHGMGMFDVKKTSPTRIIMNLLMGGSASYNIIRLDKRLTPPTSPSALTAATTNLSNVLTWTDNSGDEIGFKVYKKIGLTGVWTLIDNGGGLTVNANTTSYTDTVTLYSITEKDTNIDSTTYGQDITRKTGEHWYRVKAHNTNNGESIGSKVIMTANTK